MTMLETAIQAAQAAGAIQKEAFGSVLQVDEDTRHDIKLKVDKLCEEAIVKIISTAYPEHAILAEEGGAKGESSHRWIIDPLDGTVNFFYGIPHFCTSIALEVKREPVIGVVYDPIRDELFAAEKGKGATLNGQSIRVSAITDPGEACIVLGFMKDDQTMRAGLKAMATCIYRVRKVRCTGSAALDLA
ncbi:MAG: inositol monophosphatase, partial [Planctomycetes bacterium]|nr:inositol monophosphatase [Planctomycetota bacterium]